MSAYIQIDSVGRILYCGSLACPIDELPGYDPDFFKILSDDIDGPVNPSGFYWDKGLKEMPERPSLSHEFNYETKAWELNSDEAWVRIRFQRDQLLSATDWVTLRAQEQGTPVPQEWLDYRQALRDITDQPDPLAIVWPIPPEA